MSEHEQHHFYSHGIDPMRPGGVCLRCGGPPSDPLHLDPRDHDAVSAAIEASAPKGRTLEGRRTRMRALLSPTAPPPSECHAGPPCWSERGGGLVWWAAGMVLATPYPSHWRSTT